MTLFIVGDTDQLLYRFAGSRPEILTDDLNEWLPDIETVKLETNYRSQDEIINKSQQLINHNYSDLNGPYPQEFVKTMEGVKGQGEQIRFSMYEDANIEAIAVADTIFELTTGLRTGCEICKGTGLVDELTGRGATDYHISSTVDCDCVFAASDECYNFGDFFIGARTKAQLGYVEGALVRAGIPFINIAGGSFWASKHVADVVAYLRLANDTNNKEALERVYNIPSNNHKYGWSDKAGKFQMGDYCPTRYLGKEFLAKIKYNFDNIDKVLFGSGGWRYQTKKKDYDTVGPSKAQDLQEFVWMLRGALDQADNVGQIIRMILDDCYEKYLKHSSDIGDEQLIDAKLEDLATVEDLASRYASVDKFLAYVDEMVNAAQKAKDKDWQDYLILSTYHRLKGLERPVVFGLGWCEGENITTGEPVGLLPHTFSLVPPPDFGVLPGGDKSPIQDERCIGYVCVTRAEQHVFLSGIENYRTWKMYPSRFISEMGINK
jgi:DNA helicase-2/ATP-dependent DNA helicase PcrA